jgi:DNA invertase Pin-like site-specific DNA recombinase
MLKNTFDYQKPYNYVRYGRMSDPGQNQRSPDQQFDTIDRVIKQMGLPWRHVADYRDEFISGRYEHRRKSFQKMLSDLHTRTVIADLLLVDNIERFARFEDIPQIRKRLYDRSGVLVLASDNNFVDPKSPHGRVMSSFEALRATEEGRIKGRQVLRGKRDAVKLGHWPGGPAPFGLSLKSTLIWKNGVEEVDYRTLVPNLETGWIMKLLFDQAFNTAWGQTRLARWLNEHPDIPAKLKPFHAATVGAWFDQELYYGDFYWNEVCTDIINDVRVVQRNPEEDVLHVPNFCEPLVSREIWQVVHDRRKQRGQHMRQVREAKRADDGKLLRAPTPGRALVYPLSGLVRCGHCKRTMNPSSSSYTTESGELRRYVSYGCPAYPAGICPNGKHIPEAWLWKTDVAKLRERLFPAAG